MFFSLCNFVKLLITTVLLFFCNELFSQKNLVPNPSFEIYSQCPSASISDITLATPWETMKVSVSRCQYYNACFSGTIGGVPFNRFGLNYQYARTGNAYAGQFFFGPPENLRGYLQVKLISFLKANTDYYIEFFVNSPNSYTVATNNVGLLVSDTALIFSKFGKCMIASPQILQFGNPVLCDTLNWIKVSGIYKAHGGENYVAIGGFQDDAHTDTIQYQPVIPRICTTGGGYFIDDVSVFPLDSIDIKADAGKDTTIYKGDSAWIGSRICGITNLHWKTSTGGTVADSVPGLWVRPKATTTYILEQQVGNQSSKDTVTVTVIVPVPVSIVSGQLAVVDNGSIKFRWQTEDEVNVLRYMVERSVDGKRFDELGSVEAKGAGEYGFLDRFPPMGINHFRIKAVGKDGKIAYGKTYSIELTAPDRPLTIFPNPARERIVVSGKNLVRIQILDQLGRTIIDAKASGNTAPLDVRGLRKGVYWVKAACGDGKTTGGKFVKE